MGQTLQVSTEALPIPERGRRMTYPWNRLEVGNSFFVPNGNYQSIYSAARHWRSTGGAGQRHTSRQAEETVNGAIVRGIRVWRVS